MPLSEHEQRLLEQIEQNLYAEDPKFASTVRATDIRVHTRRRVLRAVVLFALGFLLMVVGIFTEPVLGIGGFVIMIIAALYGLSAWRRTTTRSPRPAGPRRGKAARGGGGGGGGAGSSSGGVMGRLEERWKRRWDERGR